MTSPQATFSHSVPILLLPPSEGKADGGNRRRRPWTVDAGAFGRTLGPSRRTIVDALAGSGGGDEKLLGVGGEHLVRSRTANAALVGAPTLPAWQRYTGVVWEHLEPATLTAGQRKQIVVVSGLLGLVRGDDPVPDYRLKMGANLPGVGKLSTWWRDELSSALHHAGRRRVIVDLLPHEHRAAWTRSGVEGGSRDQGRSGVRGVTVHLVDPAGRPGGHFAKAAKGALARAILVDGLDALATWHDERFDLVVTPL